MSEHRLSSIRLPIVTVAIATLCAALLIPTSATAGNGEKLLEYIPADSRFVLHADVVTLRKSKYFDQALDYLEENSGSSTKFLKFIDGKGAVDLKSNLDAVAIGTPASNLQRARKSDRAVAVFTGDFNKEDVEKLLEEHFSELSTRKLDGGTTIHVAGNRAFAMPKSNRLVVATGASSYRKKVWNVLTGDATSFQEEADTENLLSGLDTSRPIWAVSRLSKSMRSTGSNVEFAAFSVDVDSGLEAQIISRATSTANAKSMVKRMKAMKESGTENPMLQMFGAAPLLENMTIDRSKATVTAETSMTESELDVLLDKIKQIAGSQSRFSIPSDTESGGRKGDTSRTDEKSGDDSDK